MPKKYHPFKKEEIIGRGKNWFAVENAALKDLYRVSLHNSRGNDYAVSHTGGMVIYYEAGKASVDEVMGEESVYRVGSEFMDGLGKKLVPIRDKRTVKRILDDMTRQFKRAGKELGLPKIPIE